MSDGSVYVTFGGDTSGLEASAASAKAAVKDLQAELNKLARAQVAAGASADSDLGRKMLEVAAHLGEAKEAFAGATEKIREHGKAAEEGAERLSELKERLLQVAELAGVAFTADAFKEWVESSTEAAEKIQRDAASIGVSVEQVQQLAGEAKLNGADYDELVKQLERLQLSLAKTGEKASPASAALKALGISVDEIKGHTLVDQIDVMAEAFSRFADGPTKTAAAMALLGKAGADMIPFLDKGREGLDEMHEALDRAGVIMSGPTVNAIAQTRDHMNELSLAWKAASQNLYASLNPAIDMATIHMTHFIESMDEKTVEAKVGVMQAAIEKLVGSLENVDRAALGFSYDMSTGFINLAAKIGAISTETQKAGIAFQQAQYQAGLGLRPGNSEAGGAIPGIPKAADPRDLLRAAMSPAAQGAGSAPNPFGGLDNAFGSSSDKPQVPGMNLDGGKGADDAGKQAQAEAALEVEAFTSAATQKKGVLDEELRTHAIGMDQYLAQTRDMLQDEAQDISATYAAELATAGLTSAQILKIKTEEAKQLDRIAKELQQAESRYAEDLQSKYESVATTISGAFEGQLKSLLSGTETWGQAMKKIAEDLTLKLIDASITFTAKWLADEAARTVAAQAGAAARSAAEAGSASGGILASGAAIFKAIMADAAGAFSGVFAFLAPVMGPAAAGPAAGAYASVAGMAAGVASADIGMWQVPSDQLALIHHNELVMPAAQAGAFRDMLSGGGSGGSSGGSNVSVNPQTHIHVQALDGASVSSFMRNHRGDIGRHIHQAAREGALLGLRKFQR